VVTVLETASKLPPELRSQVCFVLFDLEEAGLVGSGGFWKKHKKTAKEQTVLNCDCCGDGNQIMFFPMKKLKKDEKRMENLRALTVNEGEMTLSVREKGFSYYPSDQKHFPYGVGIAAFRRSSWAGLYLGRIHTKKDTILEETNVNILRAAIISLITCSAVK
jgi:Zn-dependent M28 family amino/carboxypeptidase